jgi:Flp pilus assembly protein TadD
MAIYPPWRFDSPQLVDWLPLVGLGSLVALLWLSKNRVARALFFALMCFVAALAPVLGVVRMAYLRSGTLVADHFVYFAGVPLIALIAAGIALLWEHKHTVFRMVAAALIVLTTFALGSETVARAAVFRNEEALWADTLSKNPQAWQAHVRLGQLLFDRQQFAAALPHLQHAVDLKPKLPDNRNLLGLDYCRLQRFDEGIAEYRAALQLKQSNATGQNSGEATVRTNLANALTITGNNLSAAAGQTSAEAMQRYQEAISEYEKALQLEPRQPAIHRNLGMLLARVGRYDEAEAHLRTTLEIVPNEPIARETLAAIEANRR